MRTPLWETSAGALAALLNTRTDVIAVDLYTVTLPGGSVLRWSGGDEKVTVNGNTWLLGPAFTRGKKKSGIGITVDTMEVQVVADSTVTVSGTPLVKYISRGGFDNARLQLDIVYKAGGDAAYTGGLLWFPGRVADVTTDRTRATLQVKSELELLDVQIPREVYQPGCTNTLYDSACGQDRTALTVTGTASGASDITRTSFPHALAQAAGYFDLGVVSFTSGPNAGIGRTVKRHVAGTLTVLSPFPFAVTAGDTFAIYPGCDKTTTTCNAKFNNLLRFRGHPYVPAPETVT